MKVYRFVKNRFIFRKLAIALAAILAAVTILNIDGMVLDAQAAGVLQETLVPEEIPLEELIEYEFDQQLKELEQEEEKEYETSETVEMESEETDEIETVEEITYSTEAILLAGIMYAEEGVFLQIYENEPQMAEYVLKLAGSVVVYRMLNNHMGAETIEDVLYSPGQYDYRTIEKVESGQDIPEEVYLWAQELLNGETVGPKNMIYQAPFKQGMVYEHIGNQYFCVSNKYPAEDMVEEF